MKLPCLERFRWWCERLHRSDLPTEPGANLNNILAIDQFECFTNYVELAVFADFEELQYTEIEYSGRRSHKPVARETRRSRRKRELPLRRSGFEPGPSELRMSDFD